MNTSNASTSVPTSASAFASNHSAASGNPTLSAALNSLNLLSPQRFNTAIAVRGSQNKVQAKEQGNEQGTVQHKAPGMEERTSSKAIIPSVEITVGTDPQLLVRRAVNTVAPGPLRNFLRSVMAARDVNRVLTLLPDDAMRYQRLPIDRLRSAAVSASLQSLQGPRARDILYAAVLMAGIESLLGETVEPPYSSTDIIRSVVRKAMRTLDATDSAQAYALRNCLGWGNADESFHDRSQSLQNQVVSAVQNLRNGRILSRHARAM